MKKLVILGLVAVMTFCMTSIALGLDFNYAMGGRFYGYFSTIDGDRGFNPAPGNDCWDTILGATLRKDNTWATIKFIADSWNQKIYHSFGIDNIGGTPWSIGFDSHDSGTTNLGQQFMGDLFNDFKADPFFNTCDMAGSFNFKYITDTFEFRSEAKVYDGDGSTYNDAGDDSDYNEEYAIGFIFKSDAGKYYIGAKSTPSQEDPFFILGADLKVSDEIGLKVDFWSSKSGMNNGGEFADAFWGGEGHQTLQATLTYNELTAQLMFSQPEADVDDIIGLGLAYNVDKWTAGFKYFAVDDLVAPQDGCFYDVYGMYNVGAWDIKFGVSNAQFAYGQGGGNNAGAGDGPKATKESEDPFFYTGVHFEF